MGIASWYNIISNPLSFPPIDVTFGKLMVVQSVTSAYHTRTGLKILADENWKKNHY